MAVIIPVASKFDDSGIKAAKKAFGGLSSSLKSTIGALGVGFGISALTKQLMDASKAAVEDTKSQALLANQLRNTTGATDAAIAGTEQFISALELQTSIADDTLRPALSRLVLATGSVDQAQKLLALSTDIAAGTGKDLSTVSAAVAKAAAGQTTALFRLVPSLKGSSDWAGKAAIEFDGMAEAAANNDPFLRLETIFGRVQEEIGMRLLPELNNLADYFASPAGQKELQGYASLVKQLAEVFIFVGTTVAEFLAGFKVVGAAFGKLFSGDFAGFIELMNSRGMVDALAKLDSIGTTAASSANTQITASGITVGGSRTTGKTGTPKKTKAQIAAEKAEAAYKKALADLASFQDELKGMNDFSGLTTMTRELGQFQQSVVDTFDGINKKIAEGLANKTISTKGLDKLRSFLKAQQALLEENARQRDAIIEKRSLAQTLINDVNGALKGTGNLASLLETQTKQVTTSVTKIVDGFAVTTKRTVDEVVGGKGVVSKLKEVVAKTKAFATQLKDLKAAGLSPDLFKQIVDAGPDVGGQLATEILAGGADSVTALNDTFKELETVSAQVAEQTAVVMYNNGVEVAGGLVNGLLSQEQALVDAAKTLADAFNTAYQAQIMQLTVPNAPVVTPKSGGTVVNNTAKIQIKATPSTKADAQKLISAQQKFFSSNTGSKVSAGKFVF
jgi:hypothetical protein